LISRLLRSTALEDVVFASLFRLSRSSSAVGMFGFLY
jgi:hypothetical protein